MTHASLFSGIGGPEVAAAMLGWDNAFHCEINPFGRAVLEYWFPDSVSYEDIKTTDFKRWRGKIDILSGGFPCQPFSHAGKRLGSEDDRYLWPEMLRAIDEIRPAWVVGENVAGLGTMVEEGVLSHLDSQADLFGEGDEIHGYEYRQPFTLQRICRDLENLGYSVQPFVIPAASVGAPHRRDRYFIIAYDDNPDRRYDEGGAGTYEGEGEGEGIQERDLLREFGKPNQLRSEILRDAENPLHLGCERGTAIVGHQPGPGDTRPASRDGETRCPSPDTDRTGREKPVLPGRDTDCPEDGGRLYDRIERPGGDGTFADPDVQRCDQPIAPDFAGEKERFDNETFDKQGVTPPYSGYDFRNRKDLLPGNRWESFPTVPPIHRGDDGLPFSLDDLAISPVKWRTESLKAYGNAIVPQVIYMIFKAIDQL